MLRHLAGWLRRESRHGKGQRRWARWIGRSWARVSYGLRIEPTWLELNHCSVPIAGLADAFHSFRVVQLTDFHCGPRVSASYLDEAVELAMAQQGDAVVLTGDFIHKGFQHVDAIAESLSRLRAPFGVYAVLGNHDYSVRNSLGWRRHRHLHRAVSEALTARGIHVLHNENVTLRRAEAALHLIGVEDLWSRACDLQQAFFGVTAQVPCIVLAHNPRTIEHLNGLRCDLMLSGHTHGGQVCLPVVGRPMLGPKAKRFAAGLYRVRESYLYVNKGVGYGFRFRYGARPEVAVLSLQPA